MAKAIIDRPPVCFFCAITFQKPQMRDEALRLLTKKWGAVALSSPEWGFSEQTPYYDAEMGNGLRKQIFIFEKLQPLDKLFRAKIRTNRWEKAFSRQGNRQFNLDPGYLDEARVVLFSAKDFYHRIYQGRGIYAEITLVYKAKKGYQKLEWTFPDYGMQERVNFLEKARSWYRKRIGKS